jgi:hypothetical protein
MATLSPTNVGLIGALHEEVEKGRMEPSVEGAGQYREPLDHKLFHSCDLRSATEKSPALGVFSPVYTPVVPRFSTGVEEPGE